VFCLVGCIFDILYVLFLQQMWLILVGVVLIIVIIIIGEWHAVVLSELPLSVAHDWHMSIKPLYLAHVNKGTVLDG